MTIDNITRRCSVEGCMNPYSCKGYCKVHRERMRRNGTTDSMHRAQCTVQGCDDKHVSKGYCSKHLGRFLRHNDPLMLIRNNGTGATAEERFWSRVDKTAGYGRDGDCWEWQGSYYPNGYGAVRINHQQTGAHRMAWQFTHGRISDLLILHSCDNTRCVNPNHLREGTQKENIADAIQRGRHAKGIQINAKAVDVDTVRRSRILFAQGFSRKDVMDIENITYRTARNIDTERNYQWVI